jgi:hypothetical protein
VIQSIANRVCSGTSAPQTSSVMPRCSSGPRYLCATSCSSTECAPRVRQNDLAKVIGIAADSRGHYQILCLGHLDRAAANVALDRADCFAAKLRYSNTQ